MEDTRYKDIYTHLKNNGVKVYTPGQHKGECTAPYVVVQEGTTTLYNNFTSVQVVYDLLCYVPRDHYTVMETFKEQVRTIMRGLRPMIEPLYTETAPYYDDSVKGHMASIQYRNMRKID